MNESIIKNIKEEIASIEEKITNLESLKNELQKLNQALRVLESNDLKVIKSSDGLKQTKNSKTTMRTYANRKELDEKIVEEAVSLASKNSGSNVSTSEIRNNLISLSEIHEGMNSLQLYNRVYLVLSKKSDLFEKTTDGWLLRNK